MDEATRAPEVPDFHEVARCLGSLSTQFARVANLPAVDSGTAVLTALDTLVDRLDNLQREMREGFARLENQQREMREGFAGFQTALDFKTRQDEAR